MWEKCCRFKKFFYLCDRIIEFSTKLTTDIQPLNGCLFFIREPTEGRYCKHEPFVLRVLNSIIMKKRTKRKVVRISIRVEAARVAKVKAHTRVHNGKIVKVRSHYRKY